MKFNFEILEPCRIDKGQFGTPRGKDLTYGMFIVPYGSNNLLVMASDAEDPVVQGWEHVSVSLRNRCPNWPEMCYIKSLFWDEEDTVIQFHPPKSQYINNHEYCLHLWRNIKNDVALPPGILVGYRK